MHKPFCDWFEGHAREWLEWRRKKIKQQKHLLIVVTRDFGKTTLITNAAMCWLQLQDPELSIYIGSENVDKAAKWFSPIPKVLGGEDEHQNFTEYYGNWYNRSRDWSSTKIVHAARTALSLKDPSFGTWGARTGLTGGRADVLCFDDPISYEAMEDDADWVNKVNKHHASLIPVLVKDGMQIDIGTPYTDGDMISEQLSKHGAKSVTGYPHPESAPREQGQWEVFFLPGRTIEGEPTIPEIWPEKRMNQYERENPLHYYAQVLCTPTEGSHMQLNRADIDKLWVDEKDVPKNLIVNLHVDTAFKSLERKGHGDENVIAAVGQTRDGSGDCYFLGLWASNRASGNAFNDTLVARTQYWRNRGYRVYRITDEVEPGGKYEAWKMTIHNAFHGANVPSPEVIQLTRGGRRKAVRLTTAASFWREGHMKLVRGAAGVDGLVYQMIRVGSEQKHDDRADAVADCWDECVYRPMRLDRYKVEENDPNIPALPFDEQLKPWNYGDVRGKIRKSYIHRGEAEYQVIGGD